MAIETRSQPNSTSSDSADWTDLVHTGPGTLAGSYLRRFWQPVHNARLLEAGRAVPIRLMGEDLTLYRGNGGQAHVIAFRCAHRGTQLSTGWVEGDDLRCFYHGWKYSADGQCIEQPAESEPFCSRIRIRSYPTQEYLGLIFVYLGEGEAPALPHYPIFDNFEGVLLAGVGYKWPCNFFNQIDNDPIHASFVHRQHGGKPPMLVEAREEEYGLAYDCHSAAGKVSVAYKYMPGVLHYSAYPMPGTTERWQGLTWRVPIDDEHSMSFTVRAIPAKGDVADRYNSAGWGQGTAPLEAIEAALQVLRGERPQTDLETLPAQMALQAQDYVAQVGQGAIADDTNWHLGREDSTVAMFRQLWQRELRALAEDRPLTQWKNAGQAPASGDD
ncbi:MAG TPA: Rieske 2Fe-2S domain-containing protein [Chloroflexota bacterium]